MKIDTAFWDSSALLPLCCTKMFSAQSNRIRRKFPKFAIWWGTAVEIHCAIARLTRELAINDRQRTVGLRRWVAIYRSAKPVEPTPSLLELAVDLPNIYPLRAMDTFQLAAALSWCGERPRNRPFISADNRLGEVASDAGFDVVSLV